MKRQARKIAGQIRTAVESYINNVSPGTREDLIHHCEAFMSPISTGISSRRTTAVFS
jgi:hypothetical protein